MLKRIGFLFVYIVVVAIMPQAIRANASIVVNTTADEDGTGATCSLREAIKAANTDANYGGCTGSGAYGTDTITFDSSVFNSARVITLTSNLPDINTSMNIIGPGTNLLTVSGNDLYRPFTTNFATVTLSAMKVTRGKSDNGGNIYGIGTTVTLDHMLITLGHATNDGGGIFYPYGSLVIKDTVVSGNTAASGGGGLKAGADETDNNVFKISGSTFSGNTAGYGGAIANVGTSNGDNFVITNSTFSGNTANEGAGFHEFYGHATLVNVTMSGNTSNGGTDINNLNGSVTVRNSILANSSGQACDGAGDGVTFDHSLVEDGSCGVTSGVNGNLTGDPGLKNLASNGGSTQTHALYSISPAIDAGDNTYLSEAVVGFDFNGDGDTSDTLTTDQRGSGYDRVLLGTVDMGAYESSTQSDSLQVDTTSDSNLIDCTNQPNDCSLRGAINIANSVSGTNTITFDPNVFNGARVITLTSNLPDINTNMDIIGPGTNRLTISGNDLYRPFTVNYSTVTFSDMTITRGKGDSGGNVSVFGGTLTLDHMVITQGQATSQGGGIFHGMGTLIIKDTVVSGNRANFGGGLKSGADEYDHNVIKISNSTFSGNTAGYGGGIDNQGTYNGDNFVITNSTFSGNTANEGGGFYQFIGNATLVNVTMSGNNASNGVDISQNAAGSVTVRNSILATSSGQACAGAGVTFDYSLVEDGSCGVTSGVNGNLTGAPLLKVLASNGGSTQTHALYSNSPAIDAGDNTYLSEAVVGFDFNGDGDTSDTLTTDQRGSGYDRIATSTVDMGAYEDMPVSTGLLVDTTSDNELTTCTNRPNDCSLRGTITLANTMSGTDTITFDASVFSTPQVITLTSTLPTITTDMTINGPGANLLTISGNNLVRPIYIDISPTVTLSGVTIAQGKADYGGGIYLKRGVLTLRKSVISSNVADNQGGGIYNANGDGPGFSGTIIMVNSTVSYNQASAGGGGIYSAVGVAAISSGSVKIVNSTFYQNDGGTQPGTRGGALYVTVGGLQLINVTIDHNKGTTVGGIYVETAPTTLVNTIVSNNAFSGCDTSGATVTMSHSLITGGGCGMVDGQNGNIIYDPGIDDNGLKDNGGPTPTIALLSDGKAVNAGDNSYLSEAAVGIDFNGNGDTSDSFTTDQRGSGYSRVVANSVDMGAYEVQQVSAASSAPARNYSVAGTITLTWSQITWATGYQVQIASNSNFSSLMCGGTISVAAGNPSVSTCELPEGTYYWRVKAIPASGTSNWSGSDTFTMGAH